LSRPGNEWKSMMGRWGDEETKKQGDGGIIDKRWGDPGTRRWGDKKQGNSRDGVITNNWELGRQKTRKQRKQWNCGILEYWNVGMLDQVWMDITDRPNAIGPLHWAHSGDDRF
jgi:hypothetical protein